jgi:hypothetical protein
MDAKTKNAIAPMIELWQQRDDSLYQRIIEWAGARLAPDQANELIAIIRDSQSAIDVKTELAAIAASLLQPVTTN